MMNVTYLSLVFLREIHFLSNGASLKSLLVNKKKSTTNGHKGSLQKTEYEVIFSTKVLLVYRFISINYVN